MTMNGFNDNFVKLSTAVDAEPGGKQQASFLDGYLGSQVKSGKPTPAGEDDDDFTFCKFGQEDSKQQRQPETGGDDGQPKAAGKGDSNKSENPASSTAGRRKERCASHTKSNDTPVNDQESEAEEDVDISIDENCHLQEGEKDNEKEKANNKGSRRERRGSKSRVKPLKKEETLCSSSLSINESTSSRMGNSSSHNGDGQPISRGSSSRRRSSALEAAKRGGALASSSHHRRRDARRNTYQENSRSSSPDPTRVRRSNTAPAKRLNAMAAKVKTAQDPTLAPQRVRRSSSHRGVRPPSPEEINQEGGLPGKVDAAAKRRQSRLSMRRSMSADADPIRITRRGSTDKNPKVPPLRTPSFNSNPRPKVRRNTVNISQRQVLHGLALQDKAVKKEEKEREEQERLEAMEEKMRKLNEELERTKKEKEEAEKRAVDAEQQVGQHAHSENHMMAAPRIFVDNAAAATNQIAANVGATASAAALAAQQRASEAAARAQNTAASAAQAFTQAASVLRFPGESFDFIRRQQHANQTPMAQAGASSDDDDCVTNDVKNRQEGNPFSKFVRSSQTNNAPAPQTWTSF